MDWSTWECKSKMDIHEMEPEAIYPVPSPTIGTPEERMTIRVSKMGGGEPGREYDGRWICELYISGNLVHSSDDLNLGFPKTHEQVSAIYAGFLEAYATEEPTEDLSEWLSHLEPYSDRFNAYAHDVNERLGGVF